ncbi:MAG: alanine--glyoxylate aminotransferase family protein [Deltaproteobacteria bacterium]|nr:alanine--glyoxylate aminotransferase family protein [Deltaproteobacteria bacterium]NND30810.1 alanine--glyoxylate aminotransferase family protein [Myxococcales bacterium]MBT8465234.1 alanine--glyoxylate aminotransferase family protein [Deltaproteobacteria bacterium]NNK08933.1 alanine--glyoxylate aminotransferase family protein [Myxococcales bacterium]NNK41262.1 alanine--glyoxylate aminotransferase family protein [Myxococcales bacterium]
MTSTHRVLMGPGPSDVPSRVLEALARPTIGHLDPVFLQALDETQAMLREVFGTANALTLPMSATGSAGMETCFVNLLEPGDHALICRHGVFGGRMAEVARRCGAEVTLVDAPWGQAIDPDDVAKAAKSRAFKVLAIVHAETSTGVLQDLSPFRAIADSCGALLLVDTVTSLAGVPVDVDRMGIDAVYSGTQKCLSCPPGLSPVSFSERARHVLSTRDTPVQSWYLDLNLIGQYFGGERVYHHTAPVNMIFALHEALRLVLEEGLTARYARHRQQAEALRQGLEALGLELPVAPTDRLPPLTLVRIPDGVDDRAVRAKLLADHGLEIGGGLGDFKGKAWRIGLMGASATPRHVELCLGALREALR